MIIFVQIAVLIFPHVKAKICAAMFDGVHIKPHFQGFSQGLSIWKLPKKNRRITYVVRQMCARKVKHGKANSRPRVVLLPRLQTKAVPGQRRCNVQGRIRSM